MKSEGVKKAWGYSVGCSPHTLNEWVVKAGNTSEARCLKDSFLLKLAVLFCPNS